VDELVHKVEILHHFVSSDHKPLLTVFSGLSSTVTSPVTDVNVNRDYVPD